MKLINITNCAEKGRKDDGKRKKEIASISFVHNLVASFWNDHLRGFLYA
jgi:hypothetical protein